jgi:hypothetical protein
MLAPPFAYWFSGGALAAFAALLGTCLILLFAWYRATVREFDARQGRASVAIQRVNTDKIKILLGTQIATGERLIGTLYEYHFDEDKTRAEGWVTKTHDLITSAYGEGEAALFMSDSNYTFYIDARNPKVGELRSWIDGRLRRLTELLPRTDTLLPREDFDPDDWARSHSLS